MKVALVEHLCTVKGVNSQMCPVVCRFRILWAPKLSKKRIGRKIKTVSMTKLTDWEPCGKLNTQYRKKIQNIASRKIWKPPDALALPRLSLVFCIARVRGYIWFFIIICPWIFRRTDNEICKKWRAFSAMQ